MDVDYITDPKNGKTYSLFSKYGRKVLKKYINRFREGGEPMVMVGGAQQAGNQCKLDDNAIKSLTEAAAVAADTVTDDNAIIIGENVKIIKKIFRPCVKDALNKP